MTDSALPHFTSTLSYALKKVGEVRVKIQCSARQGSTHLDTSHPVFCFRVTTTGGTARLSTRNGRHAKTSHSVAAVAVDDATRDALFFTVHLLLLRVLSVSA